MWSLHCFETMVSTTLAISQTKPFSCKNFPLSFDKTFYKYVILSQTRFELNSRSSSVMFGFSHADQIYEAISHLRCIFCGRDLRFRTSAIRPAYLSDICLLLQLRLLVLSRWLPAAARPGSPLRWKLLWHDRLRRYELCSRNCLASNSLGRPQYSVYLHGQWIGAICQRLVSGCSLASGPERQSLRRNLRRRNPKQRSFL